MEIENSHAEREPINIARCCPGFLARRFTALRQPSPGREYPRHSSAGSVTMGYDVWDQTCGIPSCRDEVSCV